MGLWFRIKIIHTNQKHSSTNTNYDEVFTRRSIMRPCEVQQRKQHDDEVGRLRAFIDVRYGCIEGIEETRFTLIVPSTTNQ